jgi:8-oxo-dGTP pyrophosphatase MutT (NUDIX family)
MSIKNTGNNWEEIFKSNDMKSKPCINCNAIGHLYRQCPNPLISYGTIIFRIVNSDIEYVTICRRHTFGFVELIRGLFNTSDMEYISNLINEMTKDEISYLKTKSFEWLWNYLWLHNKDKEKNRKFKKEFNDALQSYSELQNNNTYLFLLNSFLSKWDEPEWGFPKGRKDKHETALNCAKRETFEETKIKSIMYECLDIDPVKEEFKGTDNRLYKHVYYIGKIYDNNFIIPSIDKEDINQIREISKLEWSTFQNIKTKFRTYNIEKIKMIENLDNFLKIKYELK